MGWVKEALAGLSEGRTVQIRPYGGSMRGRIESGQLVTIAPVDPADVQVEDVVLVAWQHNYLLHTIKEIKAIEGGQFLIGDNLGKFNGWVEGKAIKGRVIAVED